jgi:Flp pilus assembly protein TadD
MRRRFPRKLQLAPADPLAEARGRAARAHRRGDDRGEVLALRRACSIEEYDAALWTRLGAALLRVCKHDEALQAFRHALWLRERHGDEGRARVTRQLVECALARVPLRAAA